MPDDGPVELFIYWKLAPARRDAALAAVRAFQTAFAEQGIACRLLLRTDEAASAGIALTVMETYGAGTGLTPSVAARIVQAAQVALGPWAQGPRHVERFAPCPPERP